MGEKQIKCATVVNSSPGKFDHYKPNGFNEKTGVFELRIDTDGSSGSKSSDSNWQGSTTSGVDSYKVPFIVVPGAVNNGRGWVGTSVTISGLGTKVGGNWMGYIASVYDPKTKRTVWGICGDVGRQSNGWGEVSIKLAHDLGYKNASGRTSGGAKQAFVIKVYDKYLPRGKRSPQDIQKAVKELGGVLDSNIVESFVKEAKSHIGEGPSWTYKNSGGICTGGAWCGGFVTAVAKTVGILNKVIVGDSFASGIVRRSMAKGWGTFIKGPYHNQSGKPATGDIVLFRYRNNVNNRHNDEYDANHIGIVVDVAKNNKTFTVVDGNNHNKVKKGDYKTSSKTIVGYYRPDWSRVGGTVPPGSGSYGYGPLFEKENTREDAIAREVGYLGTDNKPSIKESDIRLSIINYTWMLGDVFDIVRESMSFDFEDYEDDTSDDGVPSDSKYINLMYPCPAYKTITCGFGAYRGHSGCDFSTGGKSNQKVVAAESGEVVVSEDLKNSNGSYRSYGRYIIIKHDKKTKGGKTVYTLYAHNNERLVSKGKHVKRGQHIANSGSTGNSTGPHVHFEVRIGGQSQSYAVNPANYLPKK